MGLTDEDKAWILEQLEQHRTQLEQRVESTETKLLTAFHDWASPAEMRARSHSAAIRALDLEVESPADRLTKLEPPTQRRSYRSRPDRRSCCNTSAAM
jgi:hypothetical protein